MFSYWTTKYSSWLAVHIGCQRAVDEAAGDHVPGSAIYASVKINGDGEEMLVGVKEIQNGL